MQVTFRDLTYTVPIKGDTGKNIILQQMSGYFQPGQITAMLGPSGSGKSTLLDLLSGRKTAGTMSGTILFDGLPISKRILHRASAYCEQADTLFDVLTVEEMLLYTAYLKLLMSESGAVKRGKVEKLIENLALQSCRSTKIGSVDSRGISGGKRKRVNIGISLIAEPLVLFLDEPTSGLDSKTSNEVVRLIKKLSKSNQMG